jgi:23S rRNA (guanosine2251-2'-O)-methyltransferase
MEGKEFYKKDLRGPVAFVLGAEDVGISTRVLEKVDDKISIPMREGIGSLNVSASAAVICYEKLRQEVA